MILVRGLAPAVVGGYSVFGTAELLGVGMAESQGDKVQE